jgi:tetratricopeptide (TPR) repeat protein
MPNAGFDNDWVLLAEKDPYAALGVSLAAEDKRILKRYRQIAKILHPDAQIGKDEETVYFANQVITRIINPVYQKLKQENSRLEVLATLRFKVRRLAKAEKLQPTFESAQQLLRIPQPEVDVFYENTLTQLSAHQFESPENFHATIQQIAQLNLIFLRRKMSDAVIREKRTGLITPPKAPATAPATKAEPEAVQTAEIPTINYAERYSIRALTYLQQKNYGMARQELQEALKIEPNNVEFHSMIGQAYLMEGKYGMARAHLKRALALKPNHPVAQKYMIRVTQLQNKSTTSQSSSRPSIPSKPSNLPPKTSSPNTPTSWLGRLFRQK